MSDSEIIGMSHLWNALKDIRDFIAEPDYMKRVAELRTAIRVASIPAYTFAWDDMHFDRQLSVSDTLEEIMSLTESRWRDQLDQIHGWIEDKPLPGQIGVFINRNMEQLVVIRRSTL